MTAILLFCLAAIILLNAAVVWLATRNASQRERAITAAPNVVRLRYYRKLDVVV